jgi:hypothetical protein
VTKPKKSPKPTTAELTACLLAMSPGELYSRDQVFRLIERTVRNRDRAWRDWACDVLSQAEMPDGPKPIHFHFQGD